jgi:hypothetical protein
MPAPGNVATYISQGAILTARQYDFSAVETTYVEKAFVNALIQEKIAKHTLDFSDPEVSNAFIGESLLPLNDYSGNNNISVDPSNTHVYLHNKYVETPNFFIESSVGPSGILEEASFNYIVGNNDSTTFRGFLECINTFQSTISASMEFIFTQDDSAFDNVDGENWRATFATLDPSLQLMSMAVNSAINNLSNTFSEESILRAQNYSFNNSFALGKNKNKYNTIIRNGDHSNPPAVTQNDISLNNRLSSNNIDVTIRDEDIDMDDLGTYEFSTTAGNLTTEITDSYPISPFNTDPHPNDGDSLNDLSNNYFGPIVTSGGNWSFLLTASEASDSGYKLSDPNQTDYVTLDNDAIINNRAYMNYGYGDATRNLNEIVIIQGELLIENVFNEDDEDLNGMELTTMGENLLEEQAANNGVIILDASGPYQRTTTIGSAAESYTSTFVKYVDDDDDDYKSYPVISDEIMDTRDISYSIQNILLPTGNSQYNYLHEGNVIANSNGSTLYIANDFETTPDFSSNIKSLYPNNIATYITIDNNNVLTSVSGESVFKVLDGSAVQYVKPNIKITGVTLSGETILDEQYQHYRAHYKQKTIADLNMIISDPSWSLLQGITPGLPDRYFDHTISASTDTFLKSSTPYTAPLLGAGSQFQEFPRSEEITHIIKNDASLNVNLKYQPQANGIIYDGGITDLNDSCLITWTGVDGHEYVVNIIEAETGGYNILETDWSKTNTTEEIVDAYQNGSFAGKIIKETVTETYIPVLKLPLAGFSNLYLKLPKVKSVLTRYQPGNNTISGAYTGPTSEVLDNAGDKFPITKVITRLSDDSQDPEATFTLNKSSVTTLLGKIEARNDTDPSWTALTPFADIDIHYQNPVTLTLNGFPNSSVRNFFDLDNNVVKDGGIKLDEQEYTVDLLVDTLNSSYRIRGYGYTLEKISNFASFPFNPDFPQFSSVFAVAPDNYTPIVLDASLNRDGNNNVILKIITSDTSKNLVAQIKTGNTAGFISNMTIFTSNGTYFQVDKSTYTPSEGDYFEPSTSSDTHYISGDDSSSNRFGSTGSLKVDDGIITNYSDIAPGDSIKYMLKPDYIYVDMVNGTDGPTVPISELAYQYEDEDYYSETLILPHYRGYNFFPAIGPFESGERPYHANSFGTKQIYRINRKDSQANAVWYVDGTVHDSADLGDIYSGMLSNVNYGNVGSIGNLVTFNFSRLPTEQDEDFPGGAVTIPIPITVTPDTFTIVSTNTSFNKTGKLTDNSGILFKGVNGFQLLSDRITINSSYNPNDSDDKIWKVSYGGSSLSIYKNADTWGNPASLVYYITIVSDLTYEDLTGGYQYNNGHFTVTGDNILPGTTSYLQISPPQISFTQASIHSVSSLPYTDISSSQIYQVLNDVNIEDYSYTPFEYYDPTYGLNNITFYDDEQPPRNYNEFGDDTPYPFNINGSKLKINEVRVNGTSKWFDNYINNLPYDKSLYTKFNASFNQNSGIYDISYGQIDFIGSSGRNLTFKLNGSFVPTNTYTISLLPSTTIRVSIVSIHDHVVDNEPGLRITKLLNMDAINVDNFVTGATGFERYVFKPNQYQTFDISYTVSDDLSPFPYNVHKIRHDLSVNSTFTWGDIANVTAEDASGFIFILGATDLSGQDIIKNMLVFTPDSVPQHHFTYFTAPDIMRVEDPMGNTVYRIAFNGQSYSPSFVSSEIAINTQLDNDETSPSEVFKTSISYHTPNNFPPN